MVKEVLHWSPRARVLVWLLLGACAEPMFDPDVRVPPLPPGSTELHIRRVEVMPIGQLRFRIVVDLENFAAGMVSAAVDVPRIFKLGDPLQPPPVRIADIRSSQFSVETESLHAFTSYGTSVSVNYVDLAGHSHSAYASQRWLSGPPEITEGPAPTVGDAGPVTVTGHGLGKIEGMQLVFAAASPIHMVTSDLGGVVCCQTKCVGQVPILLSPLPGEPRTFTGAVPPATVHLIRPRADDSPAAHDFVIGPTQLVYLMSAPTPASGVAGASFEIPLYHPARAPDLAGLTVRFDDLALAPISVTELSAEAAGSRYYYTRARFRVPGTAEPGVHRISAVTEFGEPLSTAQDFTVTPP
jgi:hypothetical protein